MRSLQRGLALRKCEMKMNGASDQTAAVIDKSGQSSSRSFASMFTCSAFYLQLFGQSLGHYSKIKHSTLEKK